MSQIIQLGPALLRSGNTFLEKEGKWESVEAGNIHNHLICSDTSPERAVNMLSLFYG